MVTISTGMSLRNAVDISSSQPVPLHLWLFYFCSNFKGMKILEITNGIKVLTETKACYAAAAKSLQSCLTLCDPIDGSPPGSPVLGFSRQEHWSGLPFPSPMHEKWKVKVKSLSRVWLLATPWTAAYQAPPSMGISRQEYWNGVPLPSPNKSINIYKWEKISLSPEKHEYSRRKRTATIFLK